MKKNYLLATLFLLLCFAACKKETIRQNHESKINGETVTYKLKNGGQVTVFINKKGEYIIGGDVVLSTEQIAFLNENKVNGTEVSTESTFTNEFQKVWPNGIVYYEINDGSNSSTIQNAIAHWEAYTPIRFIEHTSQANYVNFSGQPDQGAGDSKLGMVGGAQAIRLVANASLRTVIHEIGHAVGLMHEQTRNDRDTYVNINYSNITNGWKYQYDTYDVQGRGGYQTGPFDFYSVMLYPSYAADAGYPGNQTPQITKKNGATFTPGSVLSQGDIQGVEYLYKPVYIRMNWILDESTLVDQSSGAFEQLRQDHDMFLEFFSDKEFLHPMTLKHPLKVWLTSNSAMAVNGQIESTGGGRYSIDYNVGATGGYLGRAYRYYIMEYGTYTSYEESSTSLYPGLGYK